MVCAARVARVAMKLGERVTPEGTFGRWIVVPGVAFADSGVRHMPGSPGGTGRTIARASESRSDLLRRKSHGHGVDCEGSVRPAAPPGSGAVARGGALGAPHCGAVRAAGPRLRALGVLPE